MASHLGHGTHPPVAYHSSPKEVSPATRQYGPLYTFAPVQQVADWAALRRLTAPAVPAFTRVMDADAKQRWRWLPQWAPTFAVLVALLAAVVPATFYLGGEIAGVKADVAGVKDGLDRVEARMDSMEARMDSMEARMVALFADQLRDNRRDVADVRERVSALEAGS